MTTSCEHAARRCPRVAPALLGIFWGAPLVAREYETGTYRLAWTQSVIALAMVADEAGARSA